ncbi:MAG: glutamate dehydrogenase, partial [Thermoplasmata archaeon]
MKNSLAGLPYGGAKGGVRINPKNMTKEDLEKVSREYIRAFHEVVGENKDVPAPDVYTNSETMGWMLDEYEKIKGGHEPGMITGKPLALQGCKFRATSTSKGGYIIFKELLSKMDKKDVTIAVQGFGNAGYNFAKMAYDDGFKVVAVSDSKGGIFDPNGLNITEVKKVKDDTRSVVNYDAKKLSNEEIIEMEVDFLVLAALENQVTSENVEKVKASHIIELANGPISSEADDMLFKKGILVVPDTLANSGGVIGSYFEWVQNKTGNIFEESYLEERLEKLMAKNFHKVYDLHKEKNIDMRTAAYIIAIRRILDAERARGKL